MYMFVFVVKKIDVVRAISHASDSALWPTYVMHSCANLLTVGSSGSSSTSTTPYEDGLSEKGKRLCKSVINSRRKEGKKKSFTQRRKWTGSAPPITTHAIVFGENESRLLCQRHLLRRFF